MSSSRPPARPSRASRPRQRRSRTRTRTAIGLTGLLVVTGALVTLPSAQAEPTNELTVGAAKARTCTDGPARGAGVDSYTVTAPSSGLVEAAVAGAGDWDLAVFDDAGAVVAASAGFTGTERATGFVDEGTELTVQGCLRPGRAATVSVDLSFLKITGQPGTSSLVEVSTPTREDKERLQSLELDLTEHATPDSVTVVTYGEDDEKKLTTPASPTTSRSRTWRPGPPRTGVPTPPSPSP